MKLKILLMTAFLTTAAVGFAAHPGTGCENAEKRAAVEEAFQNNDYGAWRNAMTGNERILAKITKENFPKFAEARKLMHEGKREEAAQIRKELGFGPGQGEGRGPGHCGKHQSQ